MPHRLIQINADEKDVRPEETAELIDGVDRRAERVARIVRGNQRVRDRAPIVAGRIADDARPVLGLLQRRPRQDSQANRVRAGAHRDAEHSHGDRPQDSDSSYSVHRLVLPPHLSRAATLGMRARAAPAALTSRRVNR